MIEVVFSDCGYCWRQVSMQVPAVGMINQQIDQVVMESEGARGIVSNISPGWNPFLFVQRSKSLWPWLCTIFFFDGG